MSDFEIESDGEGDFEESYSFDAGARNKKSRSKPSAAYVPKKTASFFGGAAKGGGDEDVYDYDFDDQEAKPSMTRSSLKSSMPRSKSSGAHDSFNESMTSGGGSGGGMGMKRSSSIRQSLTSDDLVSQYATESALDKAQRTLQMYNKAGGDKKASMAGGRARTIKEFDENDISLDDSDQEEEVASKRRPLPKRMNTVVPAAAPMSNTFQISRSQAMAAGDGELSLPFQSPF
jgi:hypothetical protein